MDLLQTRAIKVLVVVFLICNISCREKDTVLPIYQPSDLPNELVDASLSSSKSHKIERFDLINQNGQNITEKNYHGYIYVTDFFFTRCPSICPVMTANLGRIQDAFLQDEQVKLLSVSVTPIMDSVAVLKDYSQKHGVVDTKWNVTTGDKKHIYDLARKSFFVAFDEGDGGLQDFIHTSQFVLVDPEGRIRGYYDGVIENDVDKLIRDIAFLKKEF